MDWKIVASFAGAVVAAVGIVVAIWQRGRGRYKEVRDALTKLLAATNSSRLFTVLPEDELWVEGFQSLGSIRDVWSSTNEIVQSARFVPADVRDCLQVGLGLVLELLRRRDSFMEFARGRSMLGKSELREWEDIQSAESALTRVQRHVKMHEPRLRDYAQQLMARF
jgi:hypothetical protein